MNSKLQRIVCRLSVMLFSVGICYAETRGYDVTILANAHVYTLNPQQPWAESFAYRSDGKILMVGAEQDVLKRYGDEATIIDARGDMVLPGFQDTHVHIPEAGINEGLCILPDVAPLADYEKLVADCAEQQQNSNWVRAAGVSLFNLRETTELPVDVLDRAVPDRPVLILDDLGHAVWTNTLGLKAAGITASEPDPQGGVYHRKKTTGQLTGLLLEDAQQRVRNIAATDAESAYDGLLLALETLAYYGITGVSDAGGYWQQNLSESWLRAESEDRLTVRAANSLYVYPSLDMESQIAEFKKRFRNRRGDLLQFNTAKIYIDGILDLGTAALIKPYQNPVDENYPSGFHYFQDDILQATVNALHEIGYRMHFHVIGDAAVRRALDVVAAIPDSVKNIADRRHRTTHTYMVHPDDLKRFAQYGVIADLQVGADSIDPDYHDYLAEFIGDRAYDLLPLESLYRAGATVTLSSDWDADPLSPFGIIEHALTRDTQAITDLEAVLPMLTSDAAYALGHSDIAGSIEAGKQADYVIIDQSLFEIEPEQISETTVLMTVMAGQVVYRVP